MIQVRHISYKILGISLITVLSFVKVIYAQEFEFDPPVKIPMFLSGNFCELRSDHFHAGIDIKTNGEIGEPIYAIADGYVSRVKVSSYGYGKAIYINHYNGYTSVYAHLDEFNGKIQEFVKKQQYARHSYSIDKYLPQSAIPVLKGQLIGISGNSGSSGGPHLHFELRKSDKQLPVNVLKYSLDVTDTIAPKFRSLIVYEFDRASDVLIGKKKYSVADINGLVYKISNTISSGNYVAFGVEVYDFLNGSSNKCGVYELKLYVNGNLSYNFKLDEMPFDKSRYINSHMDYEEKERNKKNVHKLYREENNKLSIYNNELKGKLELTDSILNQIKIVAYDAYGNSSSLNFDVLSDIRKHDFNNEISPLYGWNNNIEFINDNFQFKANSGSIYSNQLIPFEEISETDSGFSNTFIVGNEFVPLHTKANIKIKTNFQVEPQFHSKLLIVRENYEGDLIAYGGDYVNNVISSTVRSFGKFKVVIDTVKPLIKAHNFKNKGYYHYNDVISFYVKDNLSGVKTVNGYIDDKWCLFEYDAKNDIIEYEIDSSRLEENKLHTLKIYVMDERNNVAEYNGEFNY